MQDARIATFFLLFTLCLATINAAGCLSLTGNPPARSQDVSHGRCLLVPAMGDLQLPSQ